MTEQELNRNDSLIVTNASSIVSQKIPTYERTDLSLFNFDAAATISITISDNQSAAVGQGIRLLPNTGIVLSKTLGNNVPQSQISAIASAVSAVANVSVYERWQPKGLK